MDRDIALYGNGVTCVTPIDPLPSVILEDLDTYLGPPRIEAIWLGGSVEEVEACRAKDVAEGMTVGAFLRRWRIANALRAKEYQRLTGTALGPIRRWINQPGGPAVLEPITGKVFMHVRQPLLEGFTVDEIRRARRGENVASSRLGRGGGSDV